MATVTPPIAELSISPQMANVQLYTPGSDVVTEAHQASNCANGLSQKLNHAALVNYFAGKNAGTGRAVVLAARAQPILVDPSLRCLVQSLETYLAFGASR